MEITLSSGLRVDVYPVPPFAVAAIQARAPDKPQLAREAAWLMALPAVTVPEDWTFPEGLRYAGIEPRPGDDGRKLDYIEYGLLVTSRDIEQTQAAMYGSEITEDEIGAAEATFQPAG